MKQWLGPAAFCIAVGIASHLAVIFSAPTLIMDRAFTMLGKRGTPVHGFELAPRMTPETQSVVRPSPDLAYSACRFDLSKAPNGLRVTMAAYNGYSSLSFFDAQTNNFLTIRGDGETQEGVLVPKWATSNQAGAIYSPSEKGIILIRRLAPTAEAYAQVAEASAGDKCEVL